MKKPPRPLFLYPRLEGDLFLSVPRGHPDAGHVSSSLKESTSIIESTRNTVNARKNERTQQRGIETVYFLIDNLEDRNEGPINDRCFGSHPGTIGCNSGHWLPRMCEHWRSR